METINIIPSDYSGNPKNALGYAWQDYATKTPGSDVIVENTGKGIDYKAAALAKMAEMGIKEAYINCMWCGGFSGEISTDPNTTTPADDLPAPMTLGEIALHEHTYERLLLAETDQNNKNKVGWCNICHSYCFGDCQS